MDETVTKLTVMFEPPFWIELFEREADGKYCVCKYTFGPEPKDYEVYELILSRFCRLQFSPPVQASIPSGKTRMNPKRMQREINDAMQNKGIGTKAQQALKLEHEQRKQERKTRTRAQREEEKQQQFELRKQKRKEKHRGH